MSRESRAQVLADELEARGDLTDPAWKAAVAATPRHVLVPVAYEQRSNGEWCQSDVTSPSGLDRVYSTTTLVTALACRGTHYEGISSSTKPDLVVRMLEALDVHDGHKVLEIGTGTGYNAALLVHRLGGRAVFSVDLDAEIVDPARERLASIGFHPTLVARDGVEGLPEHAPFDRIVATCSVPAVPGAWRSSSLMVGCCWSTSSSTPTRATWRCCAVMGTSFQGGSRIGGRLSWRCATTASGRVHCLPRSSEAGGRVLRSRRRTRGSTTAWCGSWPT